MTGLIPAATQLLSHGEVLALCQRLGQEMVAVLVGPVHGRNNLPRRRRHALVVHRLCCVKTHGRTNAAGMKNGGASIRTHHFRLCVWQEQIDADAFEWRGQMTRIVYLQQGERPEKETSAEKAWRKRFCPASANLCYSVSLRQKGFSDSRIRTDQDPARSQLGFSQ